MADRDAANLDDPMVKKCLDLVTLWWAEAGKYQVLPLDDRFQARALDREELYAVNPKTTWYEGAVRIQPFEAPPTLNRSWTWKPPSRSQMAAPPDRSRRWAATPPAGASTSTTGYPPTATTSPGRSSPTSGRPTPCHPGRHIVRYEFEKTGPEPLGAGGIGRISVDGTQVAEGEIPRTCSVGYSMDETFDIGWDKGSPVSEDYGPDRPVHRDDRQRRLRHPSRPPPRPRRTPRRGQGHQRHAPPVELWCRRTVVTISPTGRLARCTDLGDSFRQECPLPRPRAWR